MKHDDDGFILGDKRLNDIEQDTQSIQSNTKQILQHLQGLSVDELTDVEIGNINDISLDEIKPVQAQPLQEKKEQKRQSVAKTQVAVPKNQNKPSHHATRTAELIATKQNELKREQDYDKLTERHHLEKRRILRAMLGQANSEIAMPTGLPNLALPNIAQPKTAKTAQRPNTRTPKMPKSALIATMIAPHAKYLSDEATKQWKTSVLWLNPTFNKMWTMVGQSFKNLIDSFDNISSYFGFSFTGAFKNVRNIFKNAVLSIPFLGGLAHLIPSDDNTYSQRAIDTTGTMMTQVRVGKYQDMASVNNTKYDDLIVKIAKQEGVPANYIKAIMHTESAYNPNARSHVGAMGLMQIMPNTVKDLAQRGGYKMTNAYDPEQSITGGAKVMKLMIGDLKHKGVIQGEFDWNNQRHLDLLTSAYNAGAGTVSKAVKSGGMPTSHENQEYRKRVLSKLDNNLAQNSSVIAQQPTSNTQQVQQRLGAYYIGDSLAVGAGGLGKGVQGQAVQGLNPSQVLQNIQNLGAKLNGQNIVLSSGLSNNVKDIANVEKQLQYLTQTAKAKVTLMGVAHQWDNKNGGQLNAQLAQLAKKYGVIFDGGFQAGNDGVHSSKYAISNKQKSLGSILSMKTPSLAPLPKNVTAQASNINIKVDNPTSTGERDFVHRA